MESEPTQSAPYIPFATFITGLDHLAAITIPNVIETSTFTYMNPHNKAQMVSTLKFFGLIGKDNRPQPALSDLAHKKDNRPEMVKNLIEKHYPDVVAHDFSKMTPTQLETTLAGKNYNVSGDTRKKAKTFLLKAAQFAGFTIHPLLTKITRNRKGGKRAAGRVERSGADTTERQEVRQRSPSTGTEKTIQLKNGGSVTLSLDVNLLELKGEDRKFIFKLIDDLDVYETSLPAE